MDQRQPSFASASGYQLPHPLRQYYLAQYHSPSFHYFQWQASPFPYGSGPSNPVQHPFNSARPLQQQMHYRQQQPSASIGYGAASAGDAMNRAQHDQGRPLPVSQIDEDLISFEDSPSLPSHNPVFSQQRQSLAAQASFTNASTFAGQQAGSSRPSTSYQTDNTQQRIDDIVHQSILRSHNHHNRVTQAPQISGLVQTTVSPSFLPYPPISHATHHGPSVHDRPLLFRQAAAIHSNGAHGTSASSGQRTSPAIQPLQQATIDKVSDIHISGMGMNASMQISSEQQSIVADAKTPATSDRRHDTEVVPKLVSFSSSSSSSSSLANSFDASSSRADPSLSSQKDVSQVTEHRPMSASASQSSAMNMSPEFSSLAKVQQGSFNSSRDSLLSVTQGRNKTRGKAAQKGLWKRNNSHKPSAKQSTARWSNLQLQSVEPNPKRIVRRDIFNTETGEVMQAPVETISKNEILSTGKVEALHKQGKMASEARAVESHSFSTNRSMQHLNPQVKMPTTARRVIKNSTEPLLSFDELFGNPSNVVNQPIVSPSLSAINDDRPPTLQQLMLLRNAAASSNSAKTSRSPSPAKTITPRAVSRLGTQSGALDQGNEASGEIISRPTSSRAQDTIEAIRKVCAESRGSSILPTLSVAPERSASPGLADNERGDNQAFHQADMLLTTNESADDVQIFTCQFCPDEYCTMAAKLKHEGVCRRRTAWPKKCCFCGRTLKDRQTLVAHAEACSKTWTGPLHDVSLAKNIRLRMALRTSKTYGASSEDLLMSENTASASATKVQDLSRFAAKTGAAGSPTNNLPTSIRKGKGRQSAPTGGKRAANSAGYQGRQRRPSKKQPAAHQLAASTSRITSGVTNPSSAIVAGPSVPTHGISQQPAPVQVASVWRGRRRGGRGSKAAKKT